jgi:hypothetical protein
MADGPMSAAGGGTPKKGGSAGVIIGVLLLLGAAGGILFYANRKEETPKTTPSALPSAPASTTAPAPETTLDLPPIELPKEAGVEDTGPKTATTSTGGGGSACSCGQNGSITDEIKQAAAARGGTAKKCYMTALEGNESLAGEMTVQVRIGPNGEACSASVLSDTTGSSKLQQCVRLKMASGSYPRPKGGCVDVKIPVVFKPKT